MEIAAIDTRRDGGFTLIELLVVVIVIGALAAIAIPIFAAQRHKATGAVAVSDLRDAATAEEAQLADSGGYANTVSALMAQGFRPSDGVQLGVGASVSGYCEVAGQDGTYWWFDSDAGGIQATTTTSLTPPDTATGSCASSAPTGVN